MKIQSINNSIVNAVKSKEELKGVNCIYSLSPDVAENPLCAFTLCIGMGKVSCKSDEASLSSSVITEVKLSLLAPSGAGGKHLSDMALLVCEAIRENLSISLITVSEPKSLSTSSTLCSDIVITVEEKNTVYTGCNIYIDGVLKEGVLLFEAEKVTLTQKRAELLNGYDDINYEYRIKLKSLKPLTNTQGFVIKADYKDFTEMYFNCSESKCCREIDKQGEASFTYTITAKDMKLTYKEVQSEQ